MGGQVVKKMTELMLSRPVISQKEEKETTRRCSYSVRYVFMYQGRKAAMESLKKAIREFVAASEPRVLFLVDELDRCRPDYAITYLETIKHIFDIKGAVFLLAADVSN